MTCPPIVFGLETEFGLAVEGEGEPDLVAESMALVRCATEPGVFMRWDYDCEDPHLDMRGFRVGELRQDADEAEYEVQDAARPVSGVEVKSDLVLSNGARFYNDHAHPEYCTPECATVEELVVQDRAGERLLMACAERLSAQRGRRVRVYKNNTDFRGHSYGCHENYLLPRALPWERLVRGAQAFLVTRQVFAGAGKFARETEDRLLGHQFQVSQRSDFFTELQSVDTMQRRPLINTRDEPHADPRRWRRFHVILGDANMSPFATRLKVGTTALVLEAICRAPEYPFPELAKPLEAVKQISQDQAFGWPVVLKDGLVSTALEVQRACLAAVRETCDLGAPERAALVRDWDAVLADLATDYRRCRDRLDWVAKLDLVRQFQAREGLADDAPWLQSLDLEYHLLDLAEGLYYGWEQAAGPPGAPAEAAVRAALTTPPGSTRAVVRGRLVGKFASAVVAAQWDHVSLRMSRGTLRIPLVDLFDPAELRRFVAVIEAARTPDDLRSLA